MIVYVTEKDDKVTMSKKEFEKLLEEKYQEGYEKAKNLYQTCTYYPPYCSWCPWTGYKSNKYTYIYTGTPTITTSDSITSATVNTIKTGEFTVTSTGGK